MTEVSTQRLLMLLASRSARKSYYEANNYGAFTDADDENIQNSAASELEDRIDRNSP